MGKQVPGWLMKILMNSYIWRGSLIFVDLGLQVKRRQTSKFCPKRLVSYILEVRYAHKCT